jgi:biopolymer transport protein ExbD
MGISAGGKPGAVKSEINVTPLVDIVLVLLIIFLVTMPIKMRFITLEVPKKLDEENVIPGKQIVVTVKADGNIVINDGSKDVSINRAELADTLRPIVAAKVGERVVFVDFDEGVFYGDAVSIMDTVKSVNADKVALKVKDDQAAASAPQ